MPRIYSTYTEEELDEITKASKEYGMTPSIFQKHCVLLRLGYNSAELEVDLNALKNAMKESLLSKQPGDTFIVSSLIAPEIWSKLNRSQKITLSLFLKEYIELHREKFEVLKVLHNKIKQYICIK